MSPSLSESMNISVSIVSGHHLILITSVGPGTGFFTLGFGQVHMVAQASLKKKQAVMIGAGSGVSTSVYSSTTGTYNP